MSQHSQEDLDLLLSLQDRVMETPPASPSHSHPLSPGNSYLSDDGTPKRTREQVDMSAFKNAVEDCLDYDPKSVKKESKSNRTNVNADPEVEKFSGLRIRNQLLTPAELNDHFSDIRFVRLSVIMNVLKGDNLSGSWATVGVLVEKGHPKTSSNGKSYSIWKLGSLNEDSISLFLFGDAYQQNMNEKAGTVFALFNCNVRRDNSGGFSLSIFSPSQILKMGMSVDYGVCKGKKKDGTTCTMKASEKYSSVSRTLIQGGNIRTAYRDHLKSEGIYLVNPLVDRSNTNKGKQPAKVLSVEGLKKALSGASKVMTNIHSQGLRMLNEVAGRKEPKNTNKESRISNQRTTEIEKRKASCLKGDPTLTNQSRQVDSSLTNQSQLGVKRTKLEQASVDKPKQSSAKLIELEIYSSDDEL
ncbi:hypothetical protein CDL15_Pgr019695 [Punica granatum]|uniref:MCM10 OB-fold domain-containing protein n=1 Tax=Punica granatum TaxID=22663 RepID=A0A218X5A2_PUNGR|nr:hypothetical protein CDL15_Pgr019695 [Punica granatum]